MAALCLDFLGFQEALKKMRDVDDKIIYALNALPTESFKGQVNSESTCRDLYAKLQESHLARQESIRSCITISASNLKKLREKRETQPDDVDTDNQFRAEQRKVNTGIPKSNPLLMPMILSSCGFSRPSSMSRTSLRSVPTRPSMSDAGPIFMLGNRWNKCND
ncbi:coiled-coil domain-containing protein 58 isoform X1 [Drosophila mauritiana]|uniref:Protein MIX23 n=1 Tax=Drosophila mauritiana TaxID=7226 RepID=A0A6P8JN53_DROMA|nr:coiled-coil domain-containing protein 58 isoform X1 [Drosophila mauritiana]